MQAFGLIHNEIIITEIPETYRSIVQDGSVEDIYPIRYWPGEKLCAHLEFALKYDGVNLGLLFLFFEHISQIELTEYIKSKPTGKYTRRIWFFYEFMTGSRLTIDDLTVGNYIDALETKKYFTIQNGKKSQRHRIVNNLLGPRTFCPIIRKTEKLTKLAATDIRKRCEEIVNAYAPALLRRALTYFYRYDTVKRAIQDIIDMPDRSVHSTLPPEQRETICEEEISLFQFPDR